jgi:hypothetical protein
MPLRSAFFEVKQKAIATGEGKVFFSSTLGETKELETTKEQTKKERVCCFSFCFKSASKVFFLFFHFGKN